MDATTEPGSTDGGVGGGAGAVSGVLGVGSVGCRRGVGTPAVSWSAGAGGRARMALRAAVKVVAQGHPAEVRRVGCPERLRSQPGTANSGRCTVRVTVRCPASTTCPRWAVQRTRLWAIPAQTSQPLLGAKCPKGTWARVRFLRSLMASSTVAWLR